MRGKICLLLAIILILGTLAACQRKDERELSVFEIKFSNDAVNELEEAYRHRYLEDLAWLGEEESLAALEKSWEAVKPLQNDNPNPFSYRYYGTFGDCVVWFIQGELQSEVRFELAGSEFWNSVTCDFYICREGELITLQEAYENGYISAEDVAIVAARHAEYNEKIQ